MKKRNSFSDLGLVIAISVFICILIKSWLFGFTWGSIVWLIISCVYFYLSWKYDSESKMVRGATAAFLILSVVVGSAVVLFDKNAMPKMHAFAGTGDTIQDAQMVHEGPAVTMYDTVEEDTAAYDSVDTLQVSEEEFIEEGFQEEIDDESVVDADSLRKAEGM